MKLLSALLLLAAAAPTVQDFRYQRPLATAPAQQGQACFAIAPGVFSHAAAGFGDLRLFRTDASAPVETPYLMDVVQSVDGSAQSIAVMNTGTHAGVTVFDAAMPDGSYNDIDIDLAARDFIATVTVWGANQQGSAGTKLGAFTIFDFTAQRLGSSTVLHLPQSDFRFLHFSIKGPIQPSAVTGLKISRAPLRTARYLTVAETSQVTLKDHTSRFELALPSGVPIDRIVFVPGPAPAQFSRDFTIATVPVPAKPQPPNAPVYQQPISAGNLLRIHGQHSGTAVNEERLTLDLSTVGAENGSRIVVAIDNGDDAPIQIKSVHLEMLERDLCFDAVPGAAYTLYYGNPNIASPRYDYPQLTTMQPGAARVALAAEAANPAFRIPPPPHKPFTERHPVLLWIALLAVIAVLAFIAYGSARKQGAGPAS
jgi:hypothetical protein